MALELQTIFCVCTLLGHLLRSGDVFSDRWRHLSRSLLYSTVCIGRVGGDDRIGLERIHVAERSILTFLFRVERHRICAVRHRIGSFISISPTALQLVACQEQHDLLRRYRRRSDAFRPPHMGRYDGCRLEASRHAVGQGVFRLPRFAWNDADAVGAVEQLSDNRRTPFASDDLYPHLAQQRKARRPSWLCQPGHSRHGQAHEASFQTCSEAYAKKLTRAKTKLRQF